MVTFKSRGWKNVHLIDLTQPMDQLRAFYYYSQNRVSKGGNSFTINLLNPTGHVMHQQFNIQQLYALPTLYLCVLYLSENKLCHSQHKLIGFYNRDEKCLLRGTNWVFK